MIAINCDLGEWESAKETEWLMQNIQQANVACGVHAGGEEQMERCVFLAEKYNVEMGMHPGVEGNKGRGSVEEFDTDYLINLVSDQYEKFIQYAGVPTHIKLHGSLYHHSEKDLEFKRKYIEFAKEKGMPVIALAGGTVIRECRKQSIPCMAEGFLDRNYTSDGSLVSRDLAHAMLSSAKNAKKRLADVEQGRGLLSISDERIMLEIDTFCLHSDSVLAKELFSK